MKIKIEKIERNEVNVDITYKVIKSFGDPNNPTNKVVARGSLQKPVDTSDADIRTALKATATRLAAQYEESDNLAKELYKDPDIEPETSANGRG